MDYVELNIPTAGEQQQEILLAELADFPFESFLTEGDKLKAYIPQEALSSCMSEVSALLDSYQVKGYRYISIETQNWNAQWESNFSPVEVDHEVLIRAPFHEADPTFRHEVVIMPKMSFGTGHHATTYLMSQTITRSAFAGLEGLDMGSGTGVLAIIAALYGAKSVDAVDIDDWAYENCQENIAVNGVESVITPYLGDASRVADKEYDFILANINRNILLANMPLFARMLRKGGKLLMSGFFTEDVEALQAKGAELGLKAVDMREREGWAVVELEA